jgi:hypothetical protein
MARQCAEELAAWAMSMPTLEERRQARQEIRQQIDQVTQRAEALIQAGADRRDIRIYIPIPVPATSAALAPAPATSPPP